MLSDLSAADLMRWMAWYEVAPRGDDRADLHAAFVAQESGGAFRKEPVPLIDLLDNLKDHWEPMTPEKVEERKRRRRERARQKFISMAKRGT